MEQTGGTAQILPEGAGVGVGVNVGVGIGVKVGVGVGVKVGVGVGVKVAVGVGVLVSVGVGPAVPLTKTVSRVTLLPPPASLPFK